MIKQVLAHGRGHSANTQKKYPTRAVCTLSPNPVVKRVPARRLADFQSRRVVHRRSRAPSDEGIGLETYRYITRAAGYFKSCDSNRRRSVLVSACGAFQRTTRLTLLCVHLRDGLRRGFVFAILAFSEVSVSLSDRRRRRLHHSLQPCLLRHGTTFIHSSRISHCSDFFNAALMSSCIRLTSASVSVRSGAR